MKTILNRTFQFGLGLFAIAPGSASALDLDYYTYNGFDQTVAAFERVALVFGDNEYIYLIAVAVILGIVFAAMAAGVKALANNGNGSTWSWAFMTLIGVLIFRGLVIPTGTVHVYDPVRNAYQPVGGVPDLVVFVAGAMNKVERIVVELVDNNGAFPYADSAGGINFQMLLNAMNDYNGGFDDYYLNKSIRRYYTDCSQMALIQPAYNFDLNQLRSGTGNLFALLQELRSPSDFTEFYDVANKGGVAVSCEDNWNNNLQPALNNGAIYTSMLNTVCQKSGFNPAVAAQLARCQAILSDQNLSVYNTAGDHIHFLRNAALATAIASALQDQNPDVGLRALTNRAVLTEGIGIAQSANEWLPTVRATVTAIVLGLFPLLVVFLVTPLAPKSMLAMLGLLSWLTFWGIADAVMHRGAMDQALVAVEEIQRHNMGLTAMMLTPEVSTKALAIFGQARGMGITIASLLAAVLVGFSGYALSSVANSFQRRVEGAGTDAATKSLTPEGQGQSLQSASQGYATALNMGSLGFEGHATASAFASGSSLSAGQQYLEATSSMGMSHGDAIRTKGAMSGGSDFGGLLAHQGNVSKSGGDPMSSGDMFTMASEVTNLEQAGRFGDARGKVEAMADTGFGNANDFNEFVSGVQTVMSASDSRTHGSNIEMFKDIHAQRTGQEMSDGEAAQAYSQMRLASYTGDIGAFNGDSGRAVDFMTNNRHLADHHLGGIMAGAHQMGVDPGTLAESSGKMQAAMQSANMSQLADMTVGEVASGAYANQVMSTQSGLALQDVMSEPGFMAGTADLAKNETLVRNANSEQLENLAAVTGIPIESLAMAQAGANRSFGFDGSDVSGLMDGGIVSGSQAPLVASGGVANVSLDADGEVMASSVRTGGSAAVDNSSRVDQSFNAGGAFGASALLTNPGNEDQLEQVLRATDGDNTARDALKMDMAAYVGRVQSSGVTLSQSAGAEGYAYASYSVPGAAEFLTGLDAGAGVRGSISGQATDATRYDVNYAAVDQVFDQSYSAAKSDASTIASERIASGQTVTAEDREDILFDRFAAHLNNDMGDLVTNLKDNQADAMRIAEDMEEVPPPPGDDGAISKAEFEETLRKSQTTSHQPKL